MTGRGRGIVWGAALAAAAAAVAGCQGGGPDLAIRCPPAPTTWIIGDGAEARELSPADYPEAAPAPATSLDIELGQRYVRERVARALERRAADPNATRGVFAGPGRLSEHQEGGVRRNLLTIRLTPWLRGASGQPASLQRSYDLRLRVVPYLLTADTMPDAGRRAALAGSEQPAVVLRFELVELVSLTHQAPVDCADARFDRIDGEVIGAVREALARQDPVRLPVAPLTALADGLLGARGPADATAVTGVALGTDAELKLGLRLSAGEAQPFSPQTSLRYPGADWGARLDPWFVRAAVRRKVEAATASAGPGVRLEGVTTEFLPGGLRVVATGTVEACGTVRWTRTADQDIAVRRRPDGRSVIVAPPPAQRTETNANLVSGACLLLDRLVRGPLNPLGSAEATVRTDEPGPPADRCPNEMGRPIDVAAGTDDRLYATSVDTDGVFYIAGRSTLIDRIAGPRPPVPPCL